MYLDACFVTWIQALTLSRRFLGRRPAGDCMYSGIELFSTLACLVAMLVTAWIQGIRSCRFNRHRVGLTVIFFADGQVSKPPDKLPWKYIHGTITSRRTDIEQTTRARGHPYEHGEPTSSRPHVREGIHMNTG